MKYWNNQTMLKILLGFIILFMVSCPNNLVDTIKDEVAVVITPPSIISIYPESGAQSIPVDMDDILITFTKQIDSSSVNGSSFTIKDENGDTLSGTYSVSNDTVAFNPSSNFLYNSLYTINATSGIHDIDGNPIPIEFTWQFTTEEAPASIRPNFQTFDINSGNNSTNSANVNLGLYASDSDGSLSGLRYRYKLESDTIWNDWIDLIDGSDTVAVALNITPGSTETFTYVAEIINVLGISSNLKTTSIEYETTAPGITAVNWDDQPVFPYNGSSLKITFDEEMSPGSFVVSDFILEKALDASSVPGEIGLNEVDSIPNIEAELWGLSLEPNTEYKVTLQSGIKDIAGNPMGGLERIWYFSTGDATDSSPPDGTVTLVDGLYGPVVTLPSGSIAKGTDNQLRIDLSGIVDDYNTVWGMKFWGSNSGAEASFETTAAWETFASFRDWTVSAGDGTKFILYKFVDSAGNESPTPGQIKIILDNTPPSTPTVVINNGATHTNTITGLVDLTLSSSDSLSGVNQMLVSSYSNFTTDGNIANPVSWQDWSPSLTDWQLPDSDGSRLVYVKTRDYLDQESVSGSSSIFLDRLNPSVIFSTDQILVNDDAQLFEGSLGSDIYDVTELYGIASYYWEQISGPGQLYFNNAYGEGSTANGVNNTEPFAWADSEGTYYIQVTVTDSSGNIGTDDPIALIWDNTEPLDISGLTVAESNPGFSTSSQPVWTWDASTGADFYRVSFVNDFLNAANYEDITTTSFSPNTPLAQGTHDLYVRAYDLAGNFSNEFTQALKSVTVDTIDPAINDSTLQYIINLLSPVITVNFSGTDGTISDSGSGIDTITWSKESGSGTFNFGSVNTNTTTVQETDGTDGNYLLGLTVTDLAGNVTIKSWPVLVDRIIPSSPVVSGPVLTPSVRPTWFWSSGGGGIGTYQWNLDTDADPLWSGDTPDTSYISLSDLAGTPPGVNHILSVREKDAAGNWSSPGAWVIEIDTDAKTPPSISIQDGIPSLRKDKFITWNAVSGLGGIAEATRYQYRIDSLGWTIVESPLSANSSSPTIIPQFSGLSDGNHTLEIQEWLTDGTQWQTAKTGSHTITVDTILPNPPLVTSVGLATGNSDRWATPDLTPNWTWSSSGGGNGRYRYKLSRINAANGTVQNITIVDWTAETTQTGYTSSTLSLGTYKFEVQERDQAGNWSDITYIKTTVDNVFPTLNSVVLTGTTGPDDPGDIYTRSRTVNVHIYGDISSELNSAYSRPVAINVYDYNVYTWDDYPTAFNEASPTAEHITVVLPDSQTARKVYIRLRDEAGNLTAYKLDDIILDTTAPTGTFSINNGDINTPSLAFKMTLNYADNHTATADLDVSTSSNGTNFNSYRTYATTMTSDYQFPSSTGIKTSTLHIRDVAGNIRTVSDSINLQLINMYYATKGSSATSVSVYWTPISGASGTTYYHLYSSTNASANPNVTPSSVETESLATSGSGITETLASNEKEELRYYWVKTYNATTGGWGPYSPAPVLGFGSNITIIYDSTDSVDTTMANYIKSVLKSNLSSYGTMPSWTVTLMPENMVSSTYSAGNRIYGDPVILTTSTASLYITPNKVRNIVSMGRGIVAMGYYGLRFIDVASDNWVSWGYPATASTDAYQQPNQIGYGNSYTYTSGKYYMYTWRYGNSVWTSPLTSTSIPVSSSENQVQIGYSNAPANERALVRPLKDNPTRGWLYGRSQDYADRFPVVRQGRFLFYGYDQMWTRSSSGWLYFINLIARMDDY